MNKNCKYCFFFNQCCPDEACEDYTPLIDNINIDEIIESRRVKFHDEWFRYIEENID